MIVPKITSCYNDSSDPVTLDYYYCDRFLKSNNFSPYVIEQCIRWAFEKFNKYFIDIINDIKKFLEDKDNFYLDLKKEGNTIIQLNKMKLIKEYIELAAGKNIDKLIEFAVIKYNENFCYNIQQLLYNFPEDYKNRDGKEYWSGTRFLPHPIVYTPEDELSFLFIKNYTKILAKIFSLQGDLSNNHIKEVSRKVKVPIFEPKKTKIKIKREDEKDVYKKEQETDAEELSYIIKKLSIYDKKNIDLNKLKPQDLEIDDDTNGYVDFIHISANLKAKNYNIKECDKFKTKMMVGYIIPTIVTTTSTITGLASLKLYTLYQTNKINFMKDCYKFGNKFYYYE